MLPTEPREPDDVPTRETAAFLASHLRAGAEVLEVGCGEGHVAAVLASRGHRVVALDSDPEAVARARRRGVPAQLATWPDFDVPRVDAVAFTRSLHHIRPLDRALEKATEILKPAGKLLVEDFAIDALDETTMRWFREVLGSRAARALILPVDGELVTDLLHAEDPMAAWHHAHNHELHTIARISQAIAETFSDPRSDSVPYLYRYLLPVLPPTAEAAAFLETVLGEERRLAQLGEVAPIGRRVAATVRSR